MRTIIFEQKKIITKIGFEIKLDYMNKRTTLEAENIILKNIRLYRKLRDIKSESMAKLLGISQSEYSKLENGLKRKWTYHLPDIAKILGVTFHELVHLNVANDRHVDYNILENGKTVKKGKPAPDIELYERLIFELKEKDRLKDELLNSIITNKENYKKKYELIRARMFINDENTRIENHQNLTF